MHPSFAVRERHNCCVTFLVQEKKVLPASAPLVHEAFQLYATGAYTKIQGLKIVTDKGLKTKRGRELSAQTFDAMLRKPIYSGWVYSSNVPELVKGKHQPIVTQEMFETVQRLLSGRKVLSAPKRKHIPAFPLRHCEVRHMWNSPHRRNEQRKAEILCQLLVPYPPLHRACERCEVHTRS